MIQMYIYLTFNLPEEELTALKDQYNYVLKLSFAILAPLLILGILTIILLYARRKHRKRILAARSMSFDLEEAYISDPVMRTTATVGDSTLKVSSFYFSEFYFKFKLLQSREL